MKCHLCRKHETSENSHIIPKLVYRWLKKTSPTGFFRQSSNPNQRKQDGPKMELLCPSCEDKFSKLETLFSNKIFQPAQRQEDPIYPIVYEEWFHRFAVSVSWRVLTFLQQDGPPKIKFDHEGKIIETLELWRKYLNEESDDIGEHVQHFVNLSTVVSSSTVEDLLDFNIYIHRSVDFDTMHSEKEAYVISKLGKVALIGTIFNTNSHTKWSGTLIEKDGGTLSPKDLWTSDLFTNFMSFGIKEMTVNRSQLTQKQNDIIGDTFFKKHGKK